MPAQNFCIWNLGLKAAKPARNKNVKTFIIFSLSPHHLPWVSPQAWPFSHFILNYSPLRWQPWMQTVCKLWLPPHPRCVQEAFFVTRLFSDDSSRIRLQCFLCCSNTDDITLWFFHESLFSDCVRGCAVAHMCHQQTKLRKFPTNASTRTMSWFKACFQQKCSQPFFSDQVKASSLNGLQM